MRDVNKEQNTYMLFSFTQRLRIRIFKRTNSLWSPLYSKKTKAIESFLSRFVTRENCIRSDRSFSNRFKIAAFDTIQCFSKYTCGLILKLSIKHVDFPKHETGMTIEKRPGHNYVLKVRILINQHNHTSDPNDNISVKRRYSYERKLKIIRRLHKENRLRRRVRSTGRSITIHLQNASKVETSYNKSDCHNALMPFE